MENIMYEFQLSTFDIDVHRLLIYRQKSAIYGVFLSTYVVIFHTFFASSLLYMNYF